MVRKIRDQIFSTRHLFLTTSPMDAVDPALESLRLVLSETGKPRRQKQQAQLLLGQKLQTLNLSKMLAAGTLSPPTFWPNSRSEAVVPAKVAAVTVASSIHFFQKALTISFVTLLQRHP